MTAHRARPTRACSLLTGDLRCANGTIEYELEVRLRRLGLSERPSESDEHGRVAALLCIRPGGGRTWWAHFEFTPINIELTILPKKIEELREADDGYRRSVSIRAESAAGCCRRLG